MAVSKHIVEMLWSKNDMKSNSTLNLNLDIPVLASNWVGFTFICTFNEIEHFCMAVNDA